MSRPSDVLLSRVQELYDRGLYLQAYEASKEAGPLRQWQGTPGRVLAARLAGQVGHERLRGVQVYRAWRECPEDPSAFIHCTYTRLYRFGLFSTWAWMNQHIKVVDQSLPEKRAEILTVQSIVHALFRDHLAADQYIAKARHEGGLPSRIETTQAFLWFQRDEHETGLNTLLQYLETDPQDEQAVSHAAQAMIRMGHHDRAEQFLRDASSRFESAEIEGVRTGFYMECDRYSEAMDALARQESLLPLRDDSTQNRLRATRAYCCYRQGQYAQAADLLAAITHRPSAKESKQETERFIARLREPGFTRQYKELNVPFVAQAYDTCAPASMAMVMQSWGDSVKQENIVEDVCYSGTPGFRLRGWVQQRGWIVREFTLDASTLYTLIDRGIPFVMSLQSVDSAHMVAVIGYDQGDDTIWFRDPSVIERRRCDVTTLLKQQASFGPMCMLAIPTAESHRLDGVDLPCAEACDSAHQVYLALDQRDRSSAVAIVEKMEQAYPNTIVTHCARKALAEYDLDPKAGVKIIDQMLSNHPDDIILQSFKVEYLKSLAMPEERIELLETLVGSGKAPSGILVQLASEISSLPDRVAECRRLLRQALRADAHNAFALVMFSCLFHREGQIEVACEVLRFCATVKDTDEAIMFRYFGVAQGCDKTQDAIKILEDRWERLGGRSAGPTTTLAKAYGQLSEYRKAENVLHQGLEKRPDDAELLFEAAGYYSECSQDRVQEADYLKRAIQAKPNWHQPRLAYAWWLQEGGDTELALESLDDIVKVQGHCPDEMLCRAAILFDAHRIAEAKSVYDLAKTKYPTDASVWLARGDAYGQVGSRGREIEESYHKAAELAPNRPDCLTKAARACIQSGRPDLALEYYDRVIEIDPWEHGGWLEKMELCLETSNADVLSSMVQGLRRYVSESHGEMATMMAACYIGDTTGVRLSLNRLFRMDNLDRDAVVYVVQQAMQTKARSSVKKQIKAMITDDAAHAIVGELWVAHEGRDPSKYVRMITRMATEDMRRNALQYIFEGWPDSSRATPAHILKMTKKFRDLLRSENDLWAMTGYAILGTNGKRAPRRAASWMKDWKTRENVAAMHLFVLVEALMLDGHVDEAFEVAEVAMDCPDAGMHISLRLFVMWYKSEAMGCLDRGRRKLSSLNRNRLTVEAECLYDLVDARVQIAEAETEAQRIQTTRRQIRALKSYRATMIGGMYRRCLKRTIRALRKTLPLRYRMGKAIAALVTIGVVTYFLSRG